MPKILKLRLCQKDSGLFSKIVQRSDYVQNALTVATNFQIGIFKFKILNIKLIAIGYCTLPTVFTVS